METFSGTPKICWTEIEHATRTRLGFGVLYIVQFQKISILPPPTTTKGVLFCTPLPPGNYSFTSYFASKLLAFKTPPPPSISPYKFPCTFHGVGIYFLWNCTLSDSQHQLNNQLKEIYRFHNNYRSPYWRPLKLLVILTDNNKITTPPSDHLLLTWQNTVNSSKFTFSLYACIDTKV